MIEHDWNILYHNNAKIKGKFSFFSIALIIIIIRCYVLLYTYRKQGEASKSGVFFIPECIVWNPLKLQNHRPTKQLVLFGGFFLT